MTTKHHWAEAEDSRLLNQVKAFPQNLHNYHNMITVKFTTPYGYRIVNMPGVQVSEIQSICNALKHDFNATDYTYIIG